MEAPGSRLQKWRNLDYVLHLSCSSSSKTFLYASCSLQFFLPELLSHTDLCHPALLHLTFPLLSAYLLQL